MCGCIIRFDPARLQGSIAAVLEAGCGLLLHRRAPRDASAKRRRSWVQRASEAPDGQDHDLPGVRCPSRFARKPRLRAIAFLEVQLEIWWCGYVTVRHDSEVKGSRDSGPRNLSGASGLGQDLTGFAKRYLRQRFFLGGGRGAREIDVDVTEGADNAVQRRISHRHSQHLEN